MLYVSLYALLFVCQMRMWEYFFFQALLFHFIKMLILDLKFQFNTHLWLSSQQVCILLHFPTPCLGISFFWADTTKESSFELASPSLLYHLKNEIQKSALSIPLQIRSMLQGRLTKKFHSIDVIESVFRIDRNMQQGSKSQERPESLYLNGVDYILFLSLNTTLSLEEMLSNFNMLMSAQVEQKIYLLISF